MSHGEKAVDLFSKGYNCAQATAGAFAEESGLEPDSVLKMLSGFGGGIGGQRDVCGAVTGMVFVLSHHNGGYAPDDNEAKAELYRIVRETCDEFREKFGTTNCRELLVKANCIPKPDPSVRNAEYYAKRPCAHFVHEAAEIVSKRIKKC
jgi:C_GCAxxG_C_C family probable redox protein